MPKQDLFMLNARVEESLSLRGFQEPPEWFSWGFPVLHFCAGARRAAESQD